MTSFIKKEKEKKNHNHTSNTMKEFYLGKKLMQNLW